MQAESIPSAADESAGPPSLMDLFSPGSADDPHPAYHAMQTQCPVQRSEGMFGGYSVNLSRYEDVMWALRHPEVFSSKDVVNIGNDMPLIPLSVDPPDHAKYRHLLDPEFSPKKMAALEPESRALVNRIIDGFATRGECEFHEDFATPLPSTIFLALIGLPQSDLPQFLQWRDDTIRPDAKNEKDAQRIREAAGHAISEYFETALVEKCSNPDDRLLSRIVTAEVDGRPLTQAEMLGMCHLLLLGGLDTVTATLDCMVAYLAEHPERRRAIVADPALMNPAIEELLRHQSPVMMVPRVLAQDVEIRGVAIAAGDGATLLIGAANCDAAEFDDADDMRLDRGANRHLAFGGGPHRCLGSHLARMELSVILGALHDRIPDYALDPEQVPGYNNTMIRTVDPLPLVFTPTGS